MQIKVNFAIVFSLGTDPIDLMSKGIALTHIGDQHLVRLALTQVTARAVVANLADC